MIVRCTAWWYACVSCCMMLRVYKSHLIGTAGFPPCARGCATRAITFIQWWFETELDSAIVHSGYARSSAYPSIRDRSAARDLYPSHVGPVLFGQHAAIDIQHSNDASYGNQELYLAISSIGMQAWRSLRRTEYRIMTTSAMQAD